jgi:glutamate synthase domain-containing protein 2
MSSLNFLATLFVVAIGIGVLAIVALYIIDVTQTKQAIRRNYPVIGRMRYFLEHMGEFFRQYFFALDREEMPFNRAQRSWAYRAAKEVDNTTPFGSTRDLRITGTPMFVSAAFPLLDEDANEPQPLRIGPWCREPYDHAPFFNISGMSYGALSRVAVKALSRGAKIAGVWYNTGEGALSSFHLEGGCDVIFQIGTAKYGVRDDDGNLSEDRLRNIAGKPEVRMFEIKLSQGAKPGKGGILPAEKVDAEIAEIRGIPVGKASISPNRHVEVKCVSTLLDFIHRVREITGKPTGIKTVVSDSSWLAELCAEIHNRGIESAPDFITVDSADGGTGAAPLALIDNVGLPISESLPMLVDELIRWDLRDRVKVICSGKLINPAEVAWALCAGADYCVSARGFMFALGCIQALQCNRNTCPTGITTHDRRLQRGLVPREKDKRVAAYARTMMKEVGLIAHACGCREPRELRRHHVRIQTDQNRSIPMSELWPYPTPGEALRQVAAE